MSEFFAVAAQHMAWAWLATGAVLLVIELASGSGWLLWPAGSAGTVGLVLFLAPLGPAEAIGLFAALTIISTYAGRRLLPHAPAPADHINERAGRVVGHSGRVAAAFHHGRGRVFVDGKEWAAEAEGDAIPGVGAEIEVVALLGGARLRVRARANTPPATDLQA